MRHLKVEQVRSSESFQRNPTLATSLLVCFVWQGQLSAVAVAVVLQMVCLLYLVAQEGRGYRLQRGQWPVVVDVQEGLEQRQTLRAEMLLSQVLLSLGPRSMAHRHLHQSLKSRVLAWDHP